MHRLLGRGRGEMAEWRGWVRWVWWAEHRTARSKVKALALIASLPVRALIDAVRAVGVYGDAVRMASGVGPLQQVVRQYGLRVAYGIGPETFYGCQLYRSERWPRARHFVDQADTEILIRRLLKRGRRVDRVMFVDKRHFGTWCRELGFPSVAALIEFENGTATPAGADHTVLPPCDLFVKPSNSAGGRGAERWIYDGAGRWTGGDRRTCDAQELVAHLASQSAALRTRLLVQRALRNDPALVPLTPGGLCTIRMVTLRPADGGAPTLLLAVFRMPVGSAAADNFGGGGVATPVDLASGRLGPAVRRDAERRDLIHAVDRHPDTGASIQGREVPHWREAVDLVLRAHAAAPAVAPAIGWDVAILADGPVLVEGNNVPGTTISQMVPGVGYGETPFIPILLAYFREHLV